MTQQSPNIQVKDIDHLGILAGIIDQMGWVDAINSHIPHLLDVGAANFSSVHN